MSRFGPSLSPFSEIMSSARHLRSVSRIMFAIAAVVGVFSTTAQAYVLEGKSWPSGSIVVMQLGLGSAGRTLQDGNTSWDDAVLPVAAMWNQTIQRVQITNLVTPVLTGVSEIG